MEGQAVAPKQTINVEIVTPCTKNFQGVYSKNHGFDLLRHNQKEQMMRMVYAIRRL
jgi:hypothetical protein